MLGEKDPHPVEQFNALGASPFLIVVDHAGNRIPVRLGSLGLPPAELERHIALDRGARALGLAIAQRIDAALIMQRYSRLVIDCNRDPRRVDSIVEHGDGTAIPGNASLSSAERHARRDAIHAPYHHAIAERLDARSGRETILIALHSFTPTLGDAARPWEIGVLHDGGETGFARRLLAALRETRAPPIGDNEPYRMDEVDHTIPLHAYPRGLAYAEIEIRQDLLRSEGAIDGMADMLAHCLGQARSRDMGAGR